MSCVGQTHNVICDIYDYEYYSDNPAWLFFVLCFGLWEWVLYLPKNNTLNVHDCVLPLTQVQYVAPTVHCAIYLDLRHSLCFFFLPSLQFLQFH